MPDDSLTLEQIRNALSASGNPWEAGETYLSSLPHNVQLQYLGKTPAPDEADIDEIEKHVLMNKEILRAEAINAISVPTVYDLRNVNGNNFVTEVKNQGACTSCVAFGTIATMESTLLVQNNNPDYSLDLSEADLFFCHGPATCSRGWWETEAYEALKFKGIVDEKCYPYNSGMQRRDCGWNSEYRCSYWDSNIYKITGFRKLTGPSQIKEWVSSKGPVSASFIVYKDFYNYIGGTIYKHVIGERMDGHCVCIVGYNDDPGYWICKNSWGQEWGDQGFFRIAYGECGIDSWDIFGVDGVKVQQTSNPKPKDAYKECVEDCESAGMFSKEECETNCKNHRPR